MDDILKGIGDQEDSRRKVSDSEAITTAIVFIPGIIQSKATN